MPVFEISGSPHSDTAANSSDLWRNGQIINICKFLRNLNMYQGLFLKWKRKMPVYFSLRRVKDDLFASCKHFERTFSHLRKSQYQRLDRLPHSPAATKLLQYPSTWSRSHVVKWQCGESMISKSVLAWIGYPSKCSSEPSTSVMCTHPTYIQSFQNCSTWIA